MKRTALLLFIFLAFTPLQELAAKPLVADISSHDITIHTAFEGTELMLFGARNDPGDIVVVVRGPERDATVRRKERIAGIWINRKKETFTDIPAFYALASSRPFEEVTKSIYFQALGIDDFSAIIPYVPNTGIMYGTAKWSPGKERSAFARALLRQMRAARLYTAKPGRVEFIGQTLFKATIPFPDNMPRGTYTAEAYLLSDGEVVGMHITPIRVYKSGFDAFVYESAHQHPMFYGLTAITLAIVAGVGASLAFQRI